jgi:hypothetical protein
MAFLVEGLSDHVRPDSTVRRIGSFQTKEEAIAAAKHTIDEFMVRECLPGMQPATLFSRYKTQGEYPFIFRDDDRTVNVGGFNHIQYANTRSIEICARTR